jgi:hypothetical protein
MPPSRLPLLLLLQQVRMMRRRASCLISFPSIWPTQTQSAG